VLNIVDDDWGTYTTSKIKVYSVVSDADSDTKSVVFTATCIATQVTNPSGGNSPYYNTTTSTWWQYSDTLKAFEDTGVGNIIQRIIKNDNFKGVAEPATNPGTPDGVVFYLASAKGTYSNFGGYVHDGERTVVLSNSTGSWVATDAGIATISNSSQKNYTNVENGNKFIKEATRKDSNIQAQNGHKVSDKVHSYNSKDEFINRAKELATYAKDNFNINDMQAISNEVIIKYIQEKIDNGLKYRSISTYISQLEKIQLGLSKFMKHREEHFQLFTREILKNVRELAKANAVISKHKNRAFSNPELIKNELKDYMKVSFELQLTHGLRVNEATYINSVNF
jgi:hypothetical protein